MFLGNLLLLSTIWNSINGHDLDNSIIGTPIISCERDQIVFEVETAKPFRGKVFVKGEYANAQCSKAYFHGKPIAAGTINAPSFGNFPGGLSSTSEFEGHPTNSRESEKHRGESDQGWKLRSEGTTGSSGLIKEKSNGGIKGNEGESSSKSQLSNENSSGNGARVGNRGPHNEGKYEEFELERGSGTSIGAGEVPREKTYGYANPYSSSQRSSEGGEKIFRSQCPSTCEPCQCGEIVSPRGRRQTNRIRLAVQLGTCNAKRDRLVSPPGVHISFVAVVSFHDSFITKLDKAYHIKCAYTELNKTVDTLLEVNNPEPSNLIGRVEAPKCEYRIKDKSGKDAKAVAVGDLVTHEWNCPTPVADIYGLLVHSCFVEGGNGERTEVIDLHGCEIDRYVLQTPNYNSSPNSLSATVDAFVFKLPDRDSIDFQCSLTVCLKENGECDGLTPPSCPASNRTRRRRSSMNLEQREWRLHSPTLTVMDLDSQGQRPAALSLLSDSPPSPVEMCISIAGFTILISASTFLGTITLSVLLAYHFMKEKL